MSITAGSTARADDFINKAQANATPANDAGRVPKLESDGRLDSFFIKLIAQFDSYESIDGTTTPKAVTLAGDNTVILSESDVLGRELFYGFVKTSNGGAKPTLINSGQSTSTTYGFVANAGANRILVVQVNLALVGTSVAPSGVTFDGNAMTLIGSSVGSRSGIAFYWRAIGTAGSNDASKNIIVTGATGFASTFAYTIGNADQSAPISDFEITRVSTNSITTTVTPTSGLSLIVHGISSRTGNAPTMDAKITVAQTEGTSRQGGTGENATMADSAYTTTFSTGHDATEQLSGGALSIKGSTPVVTTVHYDGIVNGFSGLTKGAQYRIDSTSGAIVASGNGAKVGIAISTTEILIQRKNRRKTGVVNISSGTQYIHLGFRPSVIKAYGGGNNGSYGGSFGSWRDGVYAGCWGDDSGSLLYTTYTDALIKQRLWNCTVSAIDNAGFTITYSGSIAGAFVYEAEE